MKLSTGIWHMITASFFFSLMNVCVKMIPNIPAHEIIFFRSLISFSLSATWLYRQGIPLFGNRKTFLFTRGLAGVGSLTLYFTTLQHIPLGSAATLQDLSPIFTALLAVFLLGEKLRPQSWLMFALAFVGVVVMQGFDPRIDIRYALMGLGSAFLSSVAYYSINRAKETEHPLVIVLYFPLVGIPVMGIACLFRWVQPTGIDWLYLLLTGIFTQIAQWNMTLGFMKEETCKAAITRYIGLIFAFAWGLLLFDETYPLESLAGLCMILAGVLIHVGAKKKEPPQTAQT
jgi:drug/metabolite transporter (DMT)-like permease